MGKSIHFEQVATNWKLARYVHWKCRFQPDSFPPYALDDHVKVRGRFFDLTDIEYTIAPVNDQGVEMTIRIRYRVSTQFYWYAKRIAQLLFGNAAEVNLNFNRRRAETIYATGA